MKRIITSLGMLFSVIAFSQSYVGFLNDNYSGVHAVINNPANIVDSPFKTDINLVGASAFLGNDYASVKFSDLFKKDFKFDKYVKRSPLTANEGVFNIDILGPSFMFNIAPKHSLAVSTRLRVMENTVANGDLYETINKIGNEWEYKKPLSVNVGNAMTRGNAWAEIGLSYATVLMDKKEHFLKGGLTLKYLRGTATAHFTTENATLKYVPAERKLKDITVDELKKIGVTDITKITDEQEKKLGVVSRVITAGKASYGYTKNFENAKDIKLEDFKKMYGDGFGTDLGITYEWRPEVDKYKVANSESYYRDANKYKLRIGLSVTDIGTVRYNDSDNAISEAYKLDATISKRQYDNRPKDNYSKLLSEFFTKETKTNAIKSNLPTAFHFNADWNFNNKFYLNLDTNFDIANNEKGNSIENTYSLTPRYETKWFSAYIPLSMREFSGFNAGLGFRAGPLYVGSGSVITNLFSDKSKGADVYVGLKIPIFHSRLKDVDSDGVYDKFDNCPNEFGVAENGGCPWGDTDGDGVKDNVDKCPKVAGAKENAGCPWGDADGDGITDNVDKCPKVAGVKENNGCPKVVEKVEVITKEAKKTIEAYAKSIYFNSGKSSFKLGVTQTLDMIVDVMKEYKDAKFSIEGHTDSQGKSENNQKLSDRRARAVLNYLVRKGIDPNRLSSYGFGEDYPIDTNKTRAGRANNRRVEIKLKK